ncbi:hypothetical protein, conserved [Eimeria brunetti]|uniref:Uncharacterized protein n=1 Tax=Eimeria brunetti TaxID=51314 RepID=U6LIE2_9EIME|nr:hypothetical protein, conserved [Eimeria brunetti]
MEGQGHHAVASSVVDLNPQHAVGDAARPGPDNAENTEEIAKKGTLLPRKSSSKPLGKAAPLIALSLLLLFSGTLYRVSSSWSSHRLSSQKLTFDREWTWPPIDNDSIQKYLDDLNTAAKKMKETWESSDFPVRQAFQEHFAPPPAGGQQLPEDPLRTIIDHVAKVQDCKVPPDSSVEARRFFVQHVQLLRSICRTVTLRLEELKLFVHLNQQFNVPIPVSVHEEPHEDDDDDSGYSASFGMRADDFLGYLELVGGEHTQPVDGTVAKELVFLLIIEYKHNLCNLMARYYFERVLQPFVEDDTFAAVAEYHVPYTGKPFQIGALAEAAAQIYPESSSTTNYASVRKVHQIADNWTNRRVMKAVEQQEEENADVFQRRLNTRKKLMRALINRGIAKDDLVITALFLL